MSYAEVYGVLQAGKLMNCPPWIAAGMTENRHPMYWQRWAVVIAEAEAKAQKAILRRHKQAMKS